MAELLDHQSLRRLRSIVYLVPDSLRWDGFLSAQTPIIDRLAPVQELRWSYASWTQPSHTCLLAGLLPHQNRSSLAVAAYEDDLKLWAEALRGDACGRSDFYPEFSLATFAAAHGWNTIGSVAMPVLNESTAFARGFAHYSLSPCGGNLGTQISGLVPLLSHERDFIFINAGETHYPYLMPRESVPRIGGLRGAALGTSDETEHGFSRPLLEELQMSQVEAAELIDRRLDELISLVAKPALLIIASDHGELFGELGFFGHGPFFHPKLFEVPLAAGVVS